jgi:hypothetical protein
MTQDAIESALADITAGADPRLKHLKLASLVSALFGERGIELVVTRLRSGCRGNAECRTSGRLMDRVKTELRLSD